MLPPLQYRMEAQCCQSGTRVCDGEDASLVSSACGRSPAHMAPLSAPSQPPQQGCKSDGEGWARQGKNNWFGEKRIIKISMQNPQLCLASGCDGLPKMPLTQFRNEKLSRERGDGIRNSGHWFSNTPPTCPLCVVHPVLIICEIMRSPGNRNFHQGVS